MLNISVDHFWLFLVIASTSVAVSVFNTFMLLIVYGLVKRLRRPQPIDMVFKYDATANFMGNSSFADQRSKHLTSHNNPG